MERWSEPVDLYCERASAAFWAEPVNALTNIGFILAAVAAFVHWRRTQPRDWSALALVAVTFAVGMGSFAFHTFATRGAALLDVIPIAAFVYGYFLLALRRFLQFAWMPALAWLAAFAGASLGLEAALPRGLLNGSEGYLPPLLAMLTIGWLLRRERPDILWAGAIFAVSLFLRTIDRSACEVFPLGTHFAWHLLNAAVLYVLLRATRDGPKALMPAARRA
jgi:Ceramidase